MRIPILSNVTDRATSQIVWTLRVTQGIYRFRRDYGTWPDRRLIWGAVRASRGA